MSRFLKEKNERIHHKTAQIPKFFPTVLPISMIVPRFWRAKITEADFQACLYFSKTMTIHFACRLKFFLRSLVCLSALSIFGAFLGCDGAPDGFPGNLVPATVEVYDAQTPLEGVIVSLFAANPIDSVTCSGRTDAAGKAVIQTSLASFRKDGVPADEYKITLGETVIVEHTVTPAEFSAMSYGEQQKIRSGTCSENRRREAAGSGRFVRGSREFANFLDDRYLE